MLYYVVEDVAHQAFGWRSGRCFFCRRLPELWTCFRTLRAAFGLLGLGFHSASPPLRGQKPDSRVPLDLSGLVACSCFLRLSMTTGMHGEASRRSSRLIPRRCCWEFGKCMTSRGAKGGGLLWIPWELSRTCLMTYWCASLCVYDTIEDEWLDWCSALWIVQKFNGHCRGESAYSTVYEGRWSTTVSPPDALADNCHLFVPSSEELFLAAYKTRPGQCGWMREQSSSESSLYPILHFDDLWCTGWENSSKRVTTTVIGGYDV